MTRVAGYCPMGCGQTLFLGEGGHVTCASLPCPNPCLVDDLLAVPETEHVVNLTDEGWDILHPVRERATHAGEGLSGCELHQHMAGLHNAPAEPGQYRATCVAGTWRWDRLGDPT